MNLGEVDDIDHRPGWRWLTMTVEPPFQAPYSALSRESVIRFLTRSWLAARRTSLITRGNSRVSSVRLTSMVKIAHRANEEQPKRKPGGNCRIFREEGGLGRKPEAWAGCLEAGSFGGSMPWAGRSCPSAGSSFPWA